MKSKNLEYRTPKRKEAFIVSYPKPKTSFESKNVLEEAKSKLIKEVTSKNALSKARYLLKLSESFSATTAGNILLTFISNGITSLVNNSQSTLPATVQNSTVRMTSAEDTTRVEIIRFNVGLRSTESVVSAEKQHGSTNIQLSDSISDGKDIKTRSFLKREFGFNTKSFDFLNERFFITIKDYDSIYKLNDWYVPEHSRQVPYGLVKEEFCNVKIRSSNSYHKTHFKVHVIKILDDDVSMQDLYKVTFNKDITKQDIGAIPIVYQVTNKNGDSITSNSYMNSILCHIGTSLNFAAAFKTQAKVVQTFSKYLNPGDTLDFRMKHYCGPGIRFDIAKKLLSTGDGLQPSSYGIVIEAEGTPCEAIRKSDEAVFQGTSPGWYSYEYKKGIRLVRNSSIISDASQLESNLINKYAVKVYEREFLKDRPLTISTDKIGIPSENKEYTIVSFSPEQKVYASPVSNPESKFQTKDDSIIETDDDFDELYEDEEYL